MPLVITKKRPRITKRRPHKRHLRHLTKRNTRNSLKMRGGGWGCRKYKELNEILRRQIENLRNQLERKNPACMEWRRKTLNPDSSQQGRTELYAVPVSVNEQVVAKNPSIE